jgi:hypothetical protein
MASSFKLHRNPELDRILKINLPVRRLLFIGGFALAIVLVVAGLQWNGRGKYSADMAGNIRGFARDTYWMLTVILFGLLFVLAPAMTALSFIQEKLRGTAIFQQMVLIRPLDLALGKFLGSGAAAYVAAAVILPFAILAGIEGRQRYDNMFSLYLFLIVGGLSCQALGLFVSAALSSPSDKALRGGLLVGPAIGFIGAVTGLYWYRYFSPDYHRRSDIWYFYGLQVEAYAVILVFLIFIGVWAFAGAVRRIKASHLVPVKPWPVWLFFVTAEALLVGLLWGWQPMDRYDLNSYGTAPIRNLIFYMVLNWAALLALAAGSVALSRDRLREAWSVGDDPLVLFQRQEIRNNFKTFLIALGVSITGLAALWVSFHADGANFPQNIALNQLVPVVIGFALTIAGTLCFIQYAAMQRFRARAWAGVGLVVAFYLMMGVAGTLFEDEENTANLVNPAVFAYQLTRGNDYMDRVSVKYNSYDQAQVQYYVPSRNARFGDKSALITHGLIAEGLLALGCFGLAYLKWRKIEDELLEKQG